MKDDEEKNQVEEKNVGGVKGRGKESWLEMIERMMRNVAGKRVAIILGFGRGPIMKERG